MVQQNVILHLVIHLSLYFQIELVPLLPASTILTLEIATIEIIIIPIIMGTITLSQGLENPVPSSGSPSGVLL